MPSSLEFSTKYKAYPTYDLACPIIDHIDGVTHALRANEYFARHEQYQWFLDRLKFPKIEIFDFRWVSFRNGPGSELTNLQSDRLCLHCAVKEEAEVSRREGCSEGLGRPAIPYRAR